MKRAELSIGFNGHSIVTDARLFLNSGRAAPHSRGPMLAKRWTGSEAVSLLAQPKLNGIRATADAGGIVMRGGNAITALPHIDAALSQLFQDDPALCLDGEIYAHGVGLGEIAGLARRQHPAAEGGRLSFHVFDIIADRPAAERVARVQALCQSVASDALRAVPTICCRNTAELDDHYAECLGAGFEGQMIRLPSAPYIRGRTNALLKRKPLKEADDVVAAKIRRHEERVPA